MATPTPTPPRKGEGLNARLELALHRMSFMIPRFVTAALLAALAVICTASAQVSKTFLYRCDDGSQVGANFDDPKFAYLQLDGKSLKLPQRLSGSGARYAKSGVSFWIKGHDAMLKRTRLGKTVNCVTS